MQFKTTILFFLFSIAVSAQLVPTLHNNLTDGNSYDGYTDMVLFGETMFISNSEAGNIMKVGVTTPNMPASVYLADLNYPTGLAISGNELYFFQAADANLSPDTGSLWKINLLEPTATAQLVIGDLSYPMQMDISGSNVYFVETFYDNQDELQYSLLAKIQMTPTPSKSYLWDGLYSVDDVEINGTDLYFVEFSDVEEQCTIYKMDISQAFPGSPTVFYNDPLFLAPYRMEIYNNKLYFNSDDDDIPAVYSLDLTTTNPTTVTYASPFNFNGEGMYVGELAFAADGSMYAFADNYINGMDYYLLFKTSAPLGIEDNNQLTIEAWPNPTTDALYLNGLEQASPYQIFDISGKVIRAGMLQPEQPLSVSGMQSGVYFLSVNGTKALRFIKK